MVAVQRAQETPACGARGRPVNKQEVRSHNQASRARVITPRTRRATREIETMGLCKDSEHLFVRLTNEVSRRTVYVEPIAWTARLRPTVDLAPARLPISQNSFPASSPSFPHPCSFQHSMYNT